MAPRHVGARVGLALVTAVVLSPALLPAAAKAAAPSTATRQRQHSARAARPRSNTLLAWGSWDQKRSQDQVTPRRPGTATALSDERRVAAAGAPPPVLDSSWTHAAFRAFHEMRAGCPPPPAVDGDGQEQGEPAGGGVEGPLAGVRRLASNFPRLNGGGGGGGGDDGAGEVTTTSSSSSSSKTNTRRHPETPRDSSSAAAAATAAAAAAVASERGPGGKNGGGRRTPAKKTDPAPPACWHMQGRLTNTATGQTIALVEGVELARSLAFETASPRRAAAGKRLPGGGRGATDSGGNGAEVEEELEVDKVLKPGLWTAFGALASSKFFMYQEPATGEPMEHFRNTPVEKKQPVRTYERFSQVVSHLLQPNGRLLVVSEWGGRSVKAETANNNGVEEVEGGGGGFFSGGGGGGGGGGSGGGRFGNKNDRSLSVPSSSSSPSSSSPSSSSPRRVFNLHFFVEARTPREERELKRWQERPGGRWIAFGSPPPRAHGCKEVYSYVTGSGAGRIGGSEADEGGGGEKRGAGKLRLPWLAKRKRDDEVNGAAGGSGNTALTPASSSSTSGRNGGGGGGLMSYTRYGECPTWYGTGRMCGLDVQAKRVDSFASLPAKLRQKVLEMDPDFEAGPPGTMSEVRRAARKQRLEREEERRRKGRRSLRRPFGTWVSAASSASSGGES